MPSIEEQAFALSTEELEICHELALKISKLIKDLSKNTSHLTYGGLTELGKNISVVGLVHWVQSLVGYLFAKQILPEAAVETIYDPNRPISFKLFFVHSFLKDFQSCY